MSKLLMIVECLLSRIYLACLRFPQIEGSHRITAGDLASHKERRSRITGNARHQSAKTLQVSRNTKECKRAKIRRSTVPCSPPFSHFEPKRCLSMTLWRRGLKETRARFIQFTPGRNTQRDAVANGRPNQGPGHRARGKCTATLRETLERSARVARVRLLCTFQTFQIW